MTWPLSSFTTMPKWTKEGPSREPLSTRLPCWVCPTTFTSSCSLEQTPTPAMSMNALHWDWLGKQAT